VAVSGLTGGVSQIRVGADNVCAVKDDDTWCWGSNRNRGFGADGPTESHQPVRVAVSGLPLGERNPGDICYLEDGGVSCPLGRVPTGAVVAGLEAGVSALGGFCALKGDGIWCFNIEGFISVNASVTAASPVPGLETGVSALSGTCALKDAGVWCGLGGATGPDGRNQPLAMAGLASGVTALSAGDSNMCALKDGGVWCWGSNSHGQLGNNSPPDSLVPVSVQFPASSAGDVSTGSAAPPPQAQTSADSADRRVVYAVAGAAAALAIVAAGTWVVARRRRTD
jgi:hypothetical protein